ncbi:aspartate/glutamate racemase family protein [Lysinibacillus macroides]|uniref:Aspartate racemase n=1 Tax=Lysinibacillus macroides TaxID=33935 RepID=A0A0M9DFP7_9BACI|nr:aspartate/glutamate racemase family protein [Lysinibacillus macroides]KOY79919.1 aspartate racemase [Lysinibacillus macroides]QPR67170.1 aspartate/glutamate racemase family protein [Lysinibacillus macroides]
MKTIGLIGGMSWESSAQYYRIINEEVKRRLGGLHSAQSILASVDFEMVEQFQQLGKWDEAGELLAKVASNLETAGADFIVICTNTMHKVVPIIEKAITIPILHIADATAYEMKHQKIRKVGLLGTKYTMEQDFYKEKIQQHQIEVVIPNEGSRTEINRIIFEELCLGEIKVSSKEYYLQVIHELVQQGVEGIILGCTEIGLLINAQDAAIPLFDTTIIHATYAVDVALK